MRFHDHLLNRSKEALPSRKRAALAKLAKAKLTNQRAWVDRAIGPIRLAGDGAIFLGGIAIGAGVVICRRGEPLQGRPGAIIAAGLGLVLLTILVRLLVKVRSSMTAREAIRG